MITDKKSFCFGLLFTTLVLLLDQASKWYVLQVTDLENLRQMEVTNFFNLVLVKNHGISFGMFAGHNQPLILTICALIIIAILVRWMAKSSHIITSCAIGSVIGGALGNVLDRARLGAVTDFLDFHMLGYHWPAFNIADSCIFMGVVVLCIQSMFESPKHS